MTDSATPVLLLTPLDALHRELGARMGGFAGYDMPIQYPAGLKAEHLHCRAQAGLFDVSHMGQIRVTGPREGLEKVFPIDAHDWPIGKQKYSFLLNDTGGIEDDLMAVRLSDEVRLVVNAGNKFKDILWFKALAPELTFEWIDAALVALQGPAAESVLAKYDASATAMSFMTGAWLTIDGVQCYATRSGYTGEDGYEISVPSEQAIAVCKKLLSDERVKPVGLGARDTLRLEAGLPLHGNDIDPSKTPIQANLAWAIPKVRREGGERTGGFPGASTLFEQWRAGVSEKLLGLKSSSPVPIRSHTPLVSASGSKIGEVTSGTVSPTLNQPVLLAYVDTNLSNDDAIFAVVRNQQLPLERVKLPFVQKQYKR
jgi:aminomethyltransferase